MSSPATESSPPSVLGFNPTDWEKWLAQHGEKPYRAKQVLEWIFQKRVSSFADMTNLSEGLRQRLQTEFSIDALTCVRVEGSIDTTRKFLFRLHDGRLVETVMIPASRDPYAEKQSDRITLCVSSQVGCAYDCKFCASGLAGFTRNLTAAEIVGQVLLAEKKTGNRVRNIVFMGMGEPLANFRQLIRSIEILNAHWGVNIGARYITVSTSGLAPQIKKLAEFPLQIRLAVSLHGATDAVRQPIMPVNRKYPLAELFQALEVWRDLKKQKITFEYILIEGVNAGLDQAEILAKRCRAMKAKVNLIPYNTVEGLPWTRPSVPVQEAFLDVLKSQSVPATLRREKGHDINAACGQLRLRVEEQMSSGPNPGP